MRKLSVIAVVSVVLLVAGSLQAETKDDFIKAYLLIQEGDVADKNAKASQAVEKYLEALKILRAIKKADPNWNPNILAYRTKWCADHIVKNGGAVPIEEIPLTPSRGQISASDAPLNLDELKAKAEKGDPKAQYELGRMYELGRGVSKDFVEAYKWLHLAAEQGLKKALEDRDQIAAK